MFRYRFFLYLLFFCRISFSQDSIDVVVNKLQKEQQAALAINSVEEFAQKSYQLGEYFYQLGLYTEAIKYYNEGLQSLGENKLKTLETSLKNSLGRVYLRLKDYNLATKILHEAKALAIANKDVHGQATSNGLLGTYFEKQGDYLKAIELQEESLSLFEKLNDSLGIATANENIGSIYEDLTQYEKAATYFEASYKILRDTKSFSEANVLNNIGDVYRKTNQLQKAENYTKQALAISEQLNDNSLLESANKDLSKIYALVGNFEKAYEYRVISEEYNEKALLDINRNQLNALQAEFDFKQKEAQIDLLKEQNKASTAYQYALWAILVAIVLFVTITFYYLNKKRKANQKIQNYKQRMLRAELEQKTAEEKNLQREVKAKSSSLSKYSLHLGQKNKMLADVSATLQKLSKRSKVDFPSKMENISNEIEKYLRQDDTEWEDFHYFFDDIHPHFSKRLNEISEQALSPAEIKLGMLLRLNLSSKEIAGILRVTPDSVRVARHRLRKKLPIDQGDDLIHFMLNL